MLDELIQHKRKLHHLSIDAEYLQKMLDGRLQGIDGYGPTVQQLVRNWVQTLYESFDSFNKAFGWIEEMLRREQ